jgi:hypothetical protein
MKGIIFSNKEMLFEMLEYHIKSVWVFKEVGARMQDGVQREDIDTFISQKIYEYSQKYEHLDDFEMFEVMYELK